MTIENYKFIFNWVIINELAVGNSPKEIENTNFLKKKGIKNILGLCSEDEVSWHPNLTTNFNCRRIYIPDSKKKVLPSFEDIFNSITTLEELIKDNKTFVHCFASIERSPLISILYVMKKFNLEIEDSLDYVLTKHHYTNPTNKQLKLIKDFKKSLDI